MTTASPKLIAMREWVAALKSYDEAWAPYQARDAEAPSDAETRRLKGLSDVVDRTYSHYQELSWGRAAGAA